MKKLLLGAALSLVLALPAQAADIKVGSAAAVTGPIADLAKDIVAGRNLAASQINKQGGLLKGDMLKLVLADSGCDPKVAVDAGNKLINVEQVVAIVGPSCSGATNALVQSVSIPAGVVAVSDSASAPTISHLKDNDLVFRTAASDAYQGLKLAQLTIAHKIKKVALSYANDDYNAALAGVFEKEYKKMGGKVVAVQAHEPKKASYRSEVATLAKGGANTLVLFAYYGSSGITIIRNSLETGAFNFFIGADGMVSQELIKQIGAKNLKGHGFFTTSAPDNTTAAYKNYETAAKAAKVKAAGPFVANGYDAVG